MSVFSRDRLSLPPLPAMPKVAKLPQPLEQSGCRYLGTVTDGRRVRVRSLGSAGTARIQVSGEGVDVVRLAGSFRIPVTALGSARDEAEFDGKRVDGHGALVIRWEHGERVLDSGFRLQVTQGGARETHRRWARTVQNVARKSGGSTHG
ncbi:MAG: hypothetical protein M3Y66_05535 [Actinomycetota bacterium]|nr:hypothetical protein [Actinomycetota bacterium]